MKSTALKAVLAMSLFASTTAATLANGTTDPQLVFDRAGRLVMVIKPDGLRCHFKYSEKGDFVSSAPAGCGSPADWQGAK